MTKQELVQTVANKTGMTLEKSADALDAVLFSIIESLESGHNVSLRGFGSFEVVRRAEATFRNPKTGEPIHKPAHDAPIFRASREMRDRVAART